MNHSKSTILLVDDTPANIKVLVSALQDEYELRVATNGTDALEFASIHAPDLILLDIVMPEMDGYEVCSNLKTMEQTRDLPIIFISSLDETKEKTKGFKLGAVDYITKPFEITEVLARVRTHIELKRAKEKLLNAQNILSRYVAPQLATKILEGQIEQVWGHHRKKLTLFFSDIKDFTVITDSMEPEDLANLINEYFSHMNDIINKYKGTLANIIGDGLFVFFGAPDFTNDKDHAIRCVNMAIDMQRKMKSLRQKWYDEGIEHPLEIRCGINTGMATVGGFGSKRRKEYTAMGMQVNLAARLESICPPSHILVSHSTWALIKDEISCQKREYIDVKGFRRPIMHYIINIDLDCPEPNSI